MQKNTGAQNPLGKIRQDPEGSKSHFSSDFLKPTVSDQQRQQIFSGDNVFPQCQEATGFESPAWTQASKKLSMNLLQGVKIRRRVERFSSILYILSLDMGIFFLYIHVEQ
jgi:hypothetical protein